MIVSHQLQHTYLYTTGTQIIQVLNMCFTDFFFFFFFKPNLRVEEEPIIGFVFKSGGQELIYLILSSSTLATGLHLNRVQRSKSYT